MMAGSGASDLAGFSVVINSKKTVKYMPDHERAADGAKIGFNYAWHDSIKREKHLIIEAPRPTVTTVKASDLRMAPEVSQAAAGSIRLPEMMESILSNMQLNQERYQLDRVAVKSKQARLKPTAPKLVGEVFKARNNKRPRATRRPEAPPSIANEEQKATLPAATS